MTTLTNDIKSTLVTKVLRDQFDADWSALLAERDVQFEALAKKADYGRTAAILNALKSAGINVKEELWVNYTCSVTVDYTTRKALSGEGRIRLKQYHPTRQSWELPVIFEMNLKEVKISQNYAVPITQRDINIPLTSEVESIFTKADSLSVEIRETQYNLVAVLQSVRTVNQLKALTSVFDPFLEGATTSTSTSLLAVEALNAVNALKSPKGSI